MRLNFLTYLKDPFTKEHKVFKFKDKQVAYNWFNKTTNMTTGRVNNTRKITFKPTGLVTGRDGAVIGMWKEATQ